MSSEIKMFLFAFIFIVILMGIVIVLPVLREARFG